MTKLLINNKDKKYCEFINLRRMKELDHSECAHAVAAE